MKRVNRKSFCRPRKVRNRVTQSFPMIEHDLMQVSSNLCKVRPDYYIMKIDHISLTRLLCEDERLSNVSQTSLSLTIQDIFQPLLKMSSNFLQFIALSTFFLMTVVASTNPFVNNTSTDNITSTGLNQEDQDDKTRLRNSETTALYFGIVLVASVAGIFCGLFLCFRSLVSTRHTTV